MLGTRYYEYTREYKRGGGGNVLCDSVESVTQVIVNCCVECVSRWVPVALSSIIDFTRSENERGEKGGGGVLFTQHNRGNLHGGVPLNWEEHMRIHKNYEGSSK